MKPYPWQAVNVFLYWKQNNILYVYKEYLADQYNVKIF